ncbi:hypothetical protein [Herbiconiux liangxiaofengii]|uniref:hypothetical protein n=1 Tax=Herbiconiux liangxiaofengii TaxID=3342795 RepID=UPI0035B81185
MGESLAVLDAVGFTRLEGREDDWGIVKSSRNLSNAAEVPGFDDLDGDEVGNASVTPLEESHLDEVFPRGDARAESEDLEVADVATIGTLQERSTHEAEVARGRDGSTGR